MIASHNWRWEKLEPESKNVDFQNKLHEDSLKVWKWDGVKKLKVVNVVVAAVVIIAVVGKTYLTVPFSIKE